MPRDGSGIYSLPPATAAVANDPISSAKYNTLTRDIEADANTVRPIVAGGTGGNTAAAARTALGLGTASESASTDFANVANDLSDLASASTARANLGLGSAAVLDVGTATGNIVVLDAGAKLPAAQLDIGTSANQLVALDAAAKLPAVDGSQLTNLPTGGLPPPDYTATVTTWANGTAVTLVHGLGATPKIVLVWFVCAVADGGWAVGDRIPTDYYNGTTRGCHVGFGSTDIVLGPLASYPRRKDNSSYLTLTSTNWNIGVSAWA